MSLETIGPRMTAAPTPVPPLMHSQRVGYWLLPLKRMSVGRTSCAGSRLLVHKPKRHALDAFILHGLDEVLERLGRADGAVLWRDHRRQARPVDVGVQDPDARASLGQADSCNRSRPQPVESLNHPSAQEATNLKARLTDTVDLPTPPLQLETAMISATLASDEKRPARALLGRGDEISKSTCLTHGRTLIFSRASSRHCGPRHSMR
jgi:hypothetical protein